MRPVSSRSANLFRLTLIKISLILLVACGGGGGSITVAPATPNASPTDGMMPGNPLAGLADFMPATDSSLQDIQGIVSTTDNSIDASLFRAGSFSNFDRLSGYISRGCSVELPGATATITLLKENFTDISLIANNAYFLPSSCQKV